MGKSRQALEAGSVCCLNRYYTLFLSRHANSSCQRLARGFSLKNQPNLNAMSYTEAGVCNLPCLVFGLRFLYQVLGGKDVVGLVEFRLKVFCLESAESRNINTLQGRSPFSTAVVDKWRGKLSDWGGSC